MKTSFSSLLLLVILLTNLSSLKAQSVTVRGRFLDAEEDAIKVKYVLRCDNKVVAKGKANSIQLQVPLNQKYSLTLTKRGYCKKVLHFNSVSTNLNDYRFNLMVYFHPEKNYLFGKSEVKNAVIGDVFYKRPKIDFNYINY